MTPSVERFDPHTHHFVLTISIIILIIIIIISPAPAARWTTVSVDSPGSRSVDNSQAEAPKHRA